MWFRMQQYSRQPVCLVPESHFPSKSTISLHTPVRGGNPPTARKSRLWARPCRWRRPIGIGRWCGHPVARPPPWTRRYGLGPTARGRTTAPAPRVWAPCHSLRNRSIPLTPITVPSRTPAKADPVPPPIYPMLLHIHLGFGLEFGSGPSDHDESGRCTTRAVLVVSSGPR